jgi:hypothetical protein
MLSMFILHDIKSSTGAVYTIKQQPHKQYLALDTNYIYGAEFL